MGRLHPQSELSGWLVAQGVRLGNNYEETNHLQQHRHAWLDLLIKEFEEKGD